jgi:hypothetical protein
MQDEGGAKKMNPVLERHWEKLVLGVVAALAVVYLGTRFSGSGDAAAKSVDRVSATLQTKKGQSNSRSEAPKSIPEHKSAAIGTANRAPVSTVGNPTLFSYDVVDAPPPTPTKFVFPPVTLAPPVAKPDGVELSWTLGEVKIDPADKSKLVAVPRPTFLWKVERRKKGEDWKTLDDKLKTEVLKYVDEKTEPKTDYEYKLTLGSNDPQWVKATPGIWTTFSGGPFPVRTEGIWFFDFSNMLTYPESDEPKPGQVYVTIRKYDRDQGLVEWKKIQLEGELLGVTKEGGVEVSKHRTIGKNGKQVIVDFKSGARIKKITTDRTIPYEYEECKIKTDDAGQPVCQGLEKQKGSYKINEVIFTDEDGKQQTFTKYADSGPKAGYHCEKHGGPPPPKELSPEERSAARAGSRYAAR